jgi:hypothetical protein
MNSLASRQYSVEIFMALRIVLFVSFLIFASAGLLWFYQTYHPLVLASAEARKSVEVSSEQLNELNAAEMFSDMISFALLGGVLSSGLALISATKRPMSRFFGLLTGLALGAVAGAAAGFIGHWFDDSPYIQISDPMLYSCLRWALMLILIPFAVAAACAVGADFKKDFVGAFLGAFIGILCAAFLYAILSGMVTTVEGRNKIFPHHFSNRVLIVVATIFCTASGVLWLSIRSKKMPPSPSAEGNAEA